MNNATDILTQLEELWESAESTQPQAGDAYIRRAVRDEISYEVGVAERPILARDYRVIERAKPKFKPRAVMASSVRDPEHRREVFIERPAGNWESHLRYAESDELVGPVEMVELPSREELGEALAVPYLKRGSEWPGTTTLADAALELLRGER